MTRRRTRITPWDLRIDDDGVVQVHGGHADTSEHEWAQISERVGDDLRESVIPNEPAVWAAEWVEVDGRVVSYLELVRQSVLGNWTKAMWRRVLVAQLRGRMPMLRG